MNLPSLAVHRPDHHLHAAGERAGARRRSAPEPPAARLPARRSTSPFIGVADPVPQLQPDPGGEGDRQAGRGGASPPCSGVKKLRSNSTADGAEIQHGVRLGHGPRRRAHAGREKMDQVRPALPRGIGEVQIFSFNTSDIPVIQARISAEGVDLSQNYDLLETPHRQPHPARARRGARGPRRRGAARDLDRPAPRQAQGAPGGPREAGQPAPGRLRRTWRWARWIQDGPALHGARPGRLRLASRRSRPAVNDRGPAPGRHRRAALRGAADRLSAATSTASRPWPWTSSRSPPPTRSRSATAVQKVIRGGHRHRPAAQGREAVRLGGPGDADHRGGSTACRSSGLIGALLAVLVLYFFLRRLDSTLIVSLPIPFSVLATCGTMYFLGSNAERPLHDGPDARRRHAGGQRDRGPGVDRPPAPRGRATATRSGPPCEGAGAGGAGHDQPPPLTTLIVFLPLIVGQKHRADRSSCARWGSRSRWRCGCLALLVAHPDPAGRGARPQGARSRSRCPR